MWQKQQQAVIDDNDSEVSSTNQTKFGMEKPLFEEPPAFLDPSAAKAATTEVKKKKPSILFLVAGAVLILLVITVLGLVALQKRTTVATQPNVTPSPTTIENQDVYLARIAELKQDFRDADPAQTTLPFPPVSLGITLEQPKH